MAIHFVYFSRTTINNYIIRMRNHIICPTIWALATSSIGSLVVAGCGLLAGLLYRYTFIQRINLIPSSVARVLSRILSPVFASNEPKDDQTPIGATLEIQRQELVDRKERLFELLRRREEMMLRAGNSHNQNAL
nr:expressed protein [Hymenolepis microstoma]